MDTPKKKIFEQVYSLLVKIPKGKVTTYGEIGRVLNISPRVVGYALHANPYGPEVPCHRVLNREGRVAPGYAFGGQGIQKRRLEEEGIIFKDESSINLSSYFVSLQ